MSPGRAIRDDPDFYRLSYQLAAQQLNRALTQDDAEHRASYAKEAVVSASDVVREASVKLDDYDVREAMSNSARSGLDGRQQRLWRFLQQTVVPCAEIVRAGGLLAQDRETEAELIVEPLRRRASEPEEDNDGRPLGREKLTYRAYYNFACYEASRPPDESSSRLNIRTYSGELVGGYEADSQGKPYEQAVSYLFEAFRRCHGRRRNLLALWAEIDPAFKPLRDDPLTGPVFRDLVSTCKVAEPEPDAS